MYVRVGTEKCLKRDTIVSCWDLEFLRQELQKHTVLFINGKVISFITCIQ